MFNLLTHDGEPVIPQIIIVVSITFFILQLMLIKCRKTVKNIPLYIILLGFVADIIIGFGLFGIQILSSDGYPIYTIIATILITPVLIASVLSIFLARFFGAILTKVKKLFGKFRL